MQNNRVLPSDESKEEAQRKEMMRATSEGRMLLQDRAASVAKTALVTGPGDDEATLAQAVQDKTDQERERENLRNVADAFSVRSFDTLTTTRNADSWTGNYQTQVRMVWWHSCSVGTGHSSRPAQQTTFLSQDLFRGKLKFHERAITAVDLVLPFLLSGDAQGVVVREFVCAPLQGHCIHRSESVLTVWPPMCMAVVLCAVYSLLHRVGRGTPVLLLCRRCGTCSRAFRCGRFSATSRSPFGSCSLPPQRS